MSSGTLPARLGIVSCLIVCSRLRPSFGLPFAATEKAAQQATTEVQKLEKEGEAELNKLVKEDYDTTDSNARVS